MGISAVSLLRSLGLYLTFTFASFAERFCGVQNLLRVYAGEWFVQAGLVAVMFTVLLVPVASVPLFIMHRDSPILLCYYLNERNVSSFWEHSSSYWILLGFDSAWFCALLTFFVFCAILVANIGCGMLLMLKTLR